MFRVRRGGNVDVSQDTQSRRVRTAARLSAYLLTMVLVGTGACSPFDLDPPELASLSLEGSTGDSVMVVTSTRFTPAADDPEAVNLEAADTSVVALPYQEDYPLSGEPVRFFAWVASPDGTGVTVRMRVYIDSEEWYDQTRDVAVRPHQFVFVR